MSAADTIRSLHGLVDSPSTLRTWHERGHIRKRGRNSYDVGSILNYLDDRALGQ